MGKKQDHKKDQVNLKKNRTCKNALISGLRSTLNITQKELKYI